MAGVTAPAGDGDLNGGLDIGAVDGIPTMHTGPVTTKAFTVGQVIFVTAATEYTLEQEEVLVEMAPITLTLVLEFLDAVLMQIHAHLKTLVLAAEALAPTTIAVLALAMQT